MDLIQACRLPRSLAIIKTKAHSTFDTPEAKGNNMADTAAKAAAKSGRMPSWLNISQVSTSSSVLTSAMLPPIDIVAIQATASVADKTYWEELDARPDSSGILLDANGRVCIPSVCAPFLVREFHGVTHRGRRGVLDTMMSFLCILNLSHHVNSTLDRCLVCAQNHVTKPRAKHQQLQIPEGPFQQWQVDFTHLPKRGPHKYLLVFVDRFSKWVEAFPCAKEDAKTVILYLTKHIIPRYGIPCGIDSDKGTAFTAKVIQGLAKELGITWHLHIPYHPQSSGVVERTNRTIKDKLKKAMQSMGRSDWPALIPVVLADMRMSPHKGLQGLSPYETVMGRPFSAPWRKGGHALGDGSCDVHISEYMQQLIGVLNQYWAKLHSCAAPMPEDKTHPFKVGDKLLIKQFAKMGKGLSDTKYREPAEVVAVTRTAVLTFSFPQWIHLLFKVCLQICVYTVIICLEILLSF
ncbi:protein NYNRIN [Danio aesculapii]|uniref:protein NYNRIN n=1 Tax=Danio aesculapii TaxID=1142201 RepID=UPI0024BF9B83|nr:protein NYNRIN [Danio aesculapii]